MKKLKLLILLLVISAAFTVNINSNPDQKLTSNEALSKFDKHLNSLYGKDTAGAVLLVGNSKEVIFHKAYGLSDLELKISMTKNSVFSLGSLTKTFTSTAILSLVDEKRIALTDDIRKYLPEYKAGGKVITIENLLTHSSGIIDLFAIPEWFRDWHRDVDSDYLLNLFKDKPLQFEPGARCEYSNSNYILLGRIIEKVTGQRYFDYISSKFLKPLNLINTYYPKNKDIIPGVARGYMESAGAYENPMYVSYSHLNTAGGIFSNAKDILIFLRALYHNKLLKPETLNSAITPFMDNKGNKCDYGYGSMFTEDWSIVEAAGSMLGYEVHTAYMKDLDIIIIMLTNVSAHHGNNSRYHPRPLVKELIRMLNGTTEEQLEPISISEDELSRCTGKYRINSKAFRTVTLENGKLYVQRTGGNKYHLLPLSKTEFYYNGSGPNRYIFTITDNKVTECNHRNAKGRISKAIRTKHTEIQEDRFIKLSRKELSRYEGEYKSEAGYLFKIKRSEGCLIISTTGMEDQMICPVSKVKFIPKNGPDFNIRFNRADDNNSIQFEFIMGRLKMKAEKIK